MGGIVDSFLGKGGEGSQAAAAADPFFAEAIAEQRRQFDITQGNVNPFIEAGTGALPDLIQGATVGGLDQRFADLANTDIFKTLLGEGQRAVQSQLGALGQRRSGQGFQVTQQLPTSILAGLEQLLSGRQQNLAGSGQNAALGLGSLGAANAGNIGNLLVGQGQNLSSGILADAQAKAQDVQNIISVGTTAAAFFSDPCLKENAEKIGEVGDLSLWEWDWIEGASDTIIMKYPTTGFMADEVEEKYPQHVGEYGGFAVINYPALYDELEVKYAA